MTDILSMLFGAGLVSVGVLGGAVADRIRGIKLVRQSHASVVPAEAAPPRRLAARTESIASGTPAKGISTTVSDVIAALVNAGFRKATAAQAAATCTVREQATLESWTAAALRRCARGSVS